MSHPARQGLRLALIALVAMMATSTRGQDSEKPRPGAAKPKEAAPARSATFTPEREAAARAFVRQHHPELEGLLDRLASMKRAEYERAIAELFQSSETLAALRQRDAKRYELALEAWKARSRVQLAAAQLASAGDPELEGRLRDAIAAQIDVEIRQQRYDRDQLEARLKKATEALQRLESTRDTMADNRFRNLAKQGKRPRKAAADRTKGASSGTTTTQPSKMGDPSR